MKHTAPRTGHIAVAKMMSSLFDGGASLADIVEHSGLCIHTVRGYIRQLRKERVVYISSWDEDDIGRATVPTYAIGRKPDAKRIPRSRAQTAKQWRERRKLRALIHVTAGAIQA